MRMRTFLALEIPKKVGDKFFAYTELLSGNDKLQQIRGLPTENYHLTLAFLGNIEYVLIRNLRKI